MTATHQSELDLLTDVLEEFLQKLAYQLRVATDDEENGSFDFPVRKVIIKPGMLVTQLLLEYARESFGGYWNEWGGRAA